MIKGLVSIVVTTKNEERNIANCLKSLCWQSYPHIEIVVVDNASTDNTVAIVESLGIRCVDFGPERSAQRNHGLIKHSEGEFGIYLDADMIMSPYCIEACVKDIDKLQAVGLFIPEKILGLSLFNRARNFERPFFNATAIDAVRFFRRKDFLSVGGFSEDIFTKGSGEDWDLDKKLKAIGELKQMTQESIGEDSQSINQYKTIGSKLTQLILSHDAKQECIFHNESELSMLEYFRKKTYYMTGFDSYIEKWGRSDSDIKKQFGFYYRFVGVYLERKKYFRVFSNPWLFFVAYALRISLGLLFLVRK